MSAGAQLRHQWQGRVVDGKFPLLRELGKSRHSIVFLTEFGEKQRQKAAIKLLPLETLGQVYGNKKDGQLARWKDAANLKHPHLIKLLEFGCCQIDSAEFLYIVTEYAEENLAEIIPVRSLSSEEAQQMVLPAASALEMLHRAGFVHGHIKPSNILAVSDQLKISIDGISKSGDPGSAAGAYDPPEKTTARGVSAEGDVWSLGRTLVAVLTQSEPAPSESAGARVASLDRLPPNLQGIIESCLRSDPRERATAAEIRERLEQSADSMPEADAKGGEQAGVAVDRKKMIAIGAAALLLICVLVVGTFLRHNPHVPKASDVTSPTAPADTSSTNPRVASSKAPENAPSGPSRGSVLHQVMPDVSAGALRTIQGRLRVNVQVDVDGSGTVSDAKLAHAGPSRYFSERALAAARKWSFAPARDDRQPIASVWMLRFQFSRSHVEVAPSEIKP